jgi:hypothetical protein
MEERERWHAVRTNLITLEMAAALAYDRLLRRQPVTPFRRDRLAYAIASLMPVYTYSEDKTEIRELNPDHLRSGAFTDGGRRFIYADGDEAIERLAVDSKKLPEIMVQLAEMPVLLDELRR